MRKRPARTVTLPFAVTVLQVMLCITVQAQEFPGFTSDQAEAGKMVYRDTCQKCHGTTLSNGQFGTPLKGAFFRSQWQGKSLGEFLEYLYEKMPPDAPMTMSREQAAELAAWILSQNRSEANGQRLNADPEAGKDITLPL